MKSIRMLISTALIAVPLFSLMLGDRAEAKKLVVCGPNGAARIVEKVPAGCHVLKVNSAPGSRSNS